MLSISGLRIKEITLKRGVEYIAKSFFTGHGINKRLKVLQNIKEQLSVKVNTLAGSEQ